MLKKQKIILTSSLLALLTSYQVFAEESEAAEDQLESGFEISVAAGIASVDQSGSFEWTEYDNAKLVQNNDDLNHWTVQLGVGYRFPLMELEDEEDDEIQWLPSIAPQINVYYLDGEDIEGDVYRFGYLNDADYSMDFDSTRLMFDLALTLASYENFSLFVLGGLGIAWNNSDLSVVPDAGNIYGLELDSHDTTAFAYEFGAGVTYAIDDDWGVSLQYLFADLGDVEVRGQDSISGDEDDFDVDSSDIDVNTQAILLNLTFAL